MRGIARRALSVLLGAGMLVGAGLVPAAARTESVPTAPPTAPRAAPGALYVETGHWAVGEAGPVAVDNSGHVLVAADERLLTYDETGRLLSSFATGVSTAYGLAVGPDGRIYLSEYGGLPSAVHVFSPGGASLGSYTSPGGGSFDPWGLETHPGTGQLWIANATGDEIDRVTPNAPAIGGPGTGNGRFDTPVDVAYGNGSMYVVDRDNSRIQRFRADTGVFQGKWGQLGHGAGQFELPVALDVGLGGSVLVLDRWLTGDSDLDAFSPDGVYLGTSKVPASHTFGMATDAAGNVYVSGLLASGGWGVVRMSPASYPRLAEKRVDAKPNRKKAKVKIACAAGADCHGKVRVVRSGKVVAKGSYHVAAGAKRMVKIKITPKGRTALRQRARTPVKVRLVSAGGVVKARGVLTR
ncbi:NHL repeat-containing protein [Nocardioides humi]|uniref:NHL repeat-containing protein n=1 Tax=Nocardioides humi TaxID=449461 RepID=A0ABN1ZPA2_9ACTN|nr:NHL repeat-containing protein [Nocardioides humi]